MCRLWEWSHCSVAFIPTSLGAKDTRKRKERCGRRPTSPWDQDNPRRTVGDELLCEAHEGCLGPADDYAARFCRKIDKLAVPSPSGNPLTAVNSRPELLLKFACGTLWRHQRAAGLYGYRCGEQASCHFCEATLQLITGSVGSTPRPSPVPAR